MIKQEQIKDKDDGIHDQLIKIEMNNYCALLYKLFDITYLILSDLNKKQNGNNLKFD